MATRQEFCNGMNKLYEDHGMYVGTGNGERTLDVAGKFFEMEKNYGRRDKDGNPLWYTDTARDYEYLAKCYRKKWDMSKSRAADCSGAETAVLRDLGVIPKTADYNCRTFMEKCKKEGKLVPLKELQPGDVVFNKEVVPSHMGTFVGYAGGESDMVVEFKGRDDGCVRRKLSEGGWAIGGRLPDDWFDPEYPPLTRNLYYREGDPMYGEDVMRCKNQLLQKGYLSKVSNDKFGKETDKAVRKFQTDNGLKVDGIIGQQTYKKLME